MDRNSVNKVINLMRATYPNAYAHVERPQFVALADSIEKAFSQFPNLVVENEYERWCNEQKYPPTIGDIAPKLYATLPDNPVNIPEQWQSYYDEKGRYIVIPPKGSRCYEEVNK